MPTETPNRQSAVALAYETGDLAPRVVATGRGVMAERIIEEARKAGVFVHESPALVALLMQLDLDEHIPPALYVAVAELMAWLHRLETENNPEGAREFVPSAPLPTA